MRLVLDEPKIVELALDPLELCVQIACVVEHVVKCGTRRADEIKDHEQAHGAQSPRSLPLGCEVPRPVERVRRRPFAVRLLAVEENELQRASQRASQRSSAAVSHGHLRSGHDPRKLEEHHHRHGRVGGSDKFDAVERFRIVVRPENKRVPPCAWVKRPHNVHELACPARRLCRELIQLDRESCRAQLALDERTRACRAGAPRLPFVEQLLASRTNYRRAVNCLRRRSKRLRAQRSGGATSPCGPSRCVQNLPQQQHARQ
eukprot:Amastigsp_a178768_13.p2 type:complete len:260 gc:universal Amastigsp_a178768_13:843-64(-)